MLNNLVTFFQLFAIGIALGLSGPCLLSCTPLLIAYITASGKKWPYFLKDIFIFFTGRILAYLLLGFLAGISGWLINHFLGSSFNVFLKPLSGVVSIILGLAVILNNKCFSGFCNSFGKFSGNLGLFALGFVIGIVPCMPLFVILSQITLISKNGWQGAFYSLGFGLGVSLAGLVAVISFSGLFTWLPAKFLKSEKTKEIFRIICAAFLIIFGMIMIFR